MPVIVVQAGGEGQECEVEIVEVPKINHEFIVDTNGAGDSLVGGFFAAYI